MVSLSFSMQKALNMCYVYMGISRILLSKWIHGRSMIDISAECYRIRLTTFEYLQLLPFDSVKARLYEMIVYYCIKVLDILDFIFNLAFFMYVAIL